MIRLHAALCLFVMACVHPTTTRLSHCEDAGTTREMESCLTTVLEATSRELDQVRSMLPHSLSKPELESFERAQAAWEGYRDAHCSSASALAAGGSMAPLVLLECKIRIAQERTKELKLVYGDRLK